MVSVVMVLVVIVVVLVVVVMVVVVTVVVFMLTGSLKLEIGSSAMTVDANDRACIIVVHSVVVLCAV